MPAASPTPADLERLECFALGMQILADLAKLRQEHGTPTLAQQAAVIGDKILDARIVERTLVTPPTPRYLDETDDHETTIPLRVRSHGDDAWVVVDGTEHDITDALDDGTVERLRDEHEAELARRRRHEEQERRADERITAAAIREVA